MNYSSLRRVLFSSLSHPSPALTSAVLLLLSLSLFQSLNCGRRLHNWIVVLYKRHYLLKEHCGDWGELLHPSASPPHKPDGLQIELGKRRLHAGQRLWGHVTCHAAFCTSFIMDRCSWIIHNRVVTEEDASVQQISSMHCSQYSVYR